MMAVPQPWPIEDAPKDGTLVRLLVDYSGKDSAHPLDDVADSISWTIGTNNDDNVGDGEGVGWQFAGWCWSHDHFTQGQGVAIGWLPFHEDRNEVIEACAVAAEALDREGHEWVRDSLWAEVLRRAGQNVRALKSGGAS